MLKTQLSDTLAASAGPVLKSAGFKKYGLSYVRAGETVSWLVDVQQSQWNQGAELRFTLNCGVYIPGLTAIYAGRKERTKPLIEDCALHARLGVLTERRADQWWILRQGSEAAVQQGIAEEIADELRRFGLPFLERFPDRLHCADYLVEHSEDHVSIFPQTPAQRLAYAAIVYFLCSERDRARDTLESAERAASGTPILEAVRAIRERIGVTG